MRGITYEYESFEALACRLDEANEEHDLELPRSNRLREGEWLLATFRVGERCTSVAGYVTEHGDDVRLAFEERDWAKLLCFADGATSTRDRVQEEQSQPATLAPPPNARVLIIDDDPDVQNVLKATLCAHGFVADAVTSGEEAFDYLRDEGSVDLLVLDFHLPGMTGVEFCRRLRRDARCRKLPVLFLSARSSQREILEAFTAGADDYVSKPFRARELGARIMCLLNRTRQALTDNGASLKH